MRVSAVCGLGAGSRCWALACPLFGTNITPTHKHRPNDTQLELTASVGAKMVQVVEAFWRGPARPAASTACMCGWVGRGAEVIKQLRGCKPRLLQRAHEVSMACACVANCWESVCAHIGSFVRLPFIRASHRRVIQRDASILPR